MRNNMQNMHRRQHQQTCYKMCEIIGYYTLVNRRYISESKQRRFTNISNRRVTEVGNSASQRQAAA